MEVGQSKEEFVTWNDKYLTGIPLVDEEHKKLVELCNNLHGRLLANQSRKDWQADIKSALDTCVAYAANHFRDEEKLMRSAHFEGYAHHRTEHDDFERRVRSMLWSYGGMTVADALKFTIFLRDWVLSHIAHEDKLYIPKLLEYLKSKGSSSEN